MRTSLDWKNASPAFRNMFQLVNGLIAWTTITPLFYQGGIAGSEFLFYNVGKYYIAHELIFTKNTFDAVAAVSGVIFYTIGNVLSLMTGQPFPVWDTTAAVLKYTSNSIILNNIPFTRLAPASIDYIQFNGYRLDV